METSAFFVAFVTLFATVGVADIAFIFAALTKDHTAAERRLFATRGVLIALVILIFFAFLGNTILDVFGITIPALRTAGGILLLLIAIDMVFARPGAGAGSCLDHASGRDAHPAHAGADGSVGAVPRHRHPARCARGAVRVRWHPHQRPARRLSLPLRRERLIKS